MASVPDDLGWPRWYVWHDGGPVQVFDPADLRTDEPVSPGAEVPSTRHVAYTAWPDGRVVSTVFLMLDHNHGSGGPPVLFETLVTSPFDDALDGVWARYETREVALAGHVIAVEIVALAGD